jgi:hypothetical protein
MSENEAAKADEGGAAAIVARLSAAERGSEEELVAAAIHVILQAYESGVREADILDALADWEESGGAIPADLAQKWRLVQELLGVDVPPVLRAPLAVAVSSGDTTLAEREARALREFQPEVARAFSERLRARAPTLHSMSADWLSEGRPRASGPLWVRLILYASLALAGLRALSFVGTLLERPPKKVMPMGGPEPAASQLVDLADREGATALRDEARKAGDALQKSDCPTAKASVRSILELYQSTSKTNELAEGVRNLNTRVAEVCK